MSVYTIHLTFEIRYTANDGGKVPRPLFKTYDSVPGVFLEFVHLVSTFQLQAIVFQSNSRCSLSSGRYEFTWRKYRPILHRDVIKLLSLFFYIYIYIYIRQWKSRVISGGRRTRSRTIFFLSIVKLARLERSDTPFDDQAMQLMHFLLHRRSRRALYTFLFNPERAIGGGPFSFIEIQSPVSWTIANLKVFPSLMFVSANYSYNTIHSFERSR